MGRRKKSETVVLEPKPVKPVKLVTACETCCHFSVLRKKCKLKDPRECLDNGLESYEEFLGYVMPVSSGYIIQSKNKEIKNSRNAR